MRIAENRKQPRRFQRRSEGHRHHAGPYLLRLLLTEPAVPAGSIIFSQTLPP
jgi:hypothetical protein